MATRKPAGPKEYTVLPQDREEIMNCRGGSYFVTDIVNRAANGERLTEKQMLPVVNLLLILVREDNLHEQDAERIPESCGCTTDDKGTVGETKGRKGRTFLARNS